MTAEYRLIVKAGTPQTISTDDNGISVAIRDREYLFMQGGEQAILGVLDEIALNLPAALAHLQLQTRDVTDWTAL